VARTSNTPLVAAPTVGRMSFGTMSSPGGGIAADRVALVSGRPSDLTPPFRFRDLDAPGAASYPWVDLRIL